MEHDHHIIVKGRVQGVCFRATTKQIASQLGIFGTVRNLDDGSVEIVVQGDQNQVETLIEKLQSQRGIYQIEETLVTEHPRSETHTSFQILY